MCPWEFCRSSNCSSLVSHKNLAQNTYLSVETLGMEHVHIPVCHSIRVINLLQIVVRILLVEHWNSSTVPG